MIILKSIILGITLFAYVIVVVTGIISSILYALELWEDS